MANQFTMNPFSCTTAMGSTYRATVTAGQQTNVLRITKIVWVGGTGASTATVQDGHGNTILVTTAITGQDTTTNFIPALLVPDFLVSTLATGTLYIYLG